MKSRRVLALSFAALLSSCTGCIPTGVNVWERDILAREEMQPGHDSIDRAMDDHIYFSKEAASGGRSLGGGGCGCN